MPASTPKLALPYPLPTDQVSEGAADIQALAARVEAVMAGLWRSIAAVTAGTVKVTANGTILDAGAANYLAVRTRVILSVAGLEDDGSDYMMYFDLRDNGVSVTPILQLAGAGHGPGGSAVYVFTPTAGSHRFQAYASTSNGSTKDCHGPLSLLVDQVV